MKQSVLVIGAAGMDIKGSPGQVLRLKEDNPGEINQSYGGVARNIAENLARLNVDTTLLSAVGDDIVGDGLLRHALSSGINVEHVRRCPNQQTGSYISVMDETGDMMVAINNYGNIIKQVNGIYLEEKESLFANAGVVILDLSLAEEAVAAAFTLAGKYRIPVAVDPTAPAYAEKLIPHMSQTWMVLPNGMEAARMCGEDFDNHNKLPEHEHGMQLARKLVEKGVSVVIVTLGKQGVAYADSRSDRYHPAPKVDKIQDTTGAGDALTAGVIYGGLHKLPPGEMVQIGISAAIITLGCQYSVSPDLTPELLQPIKPSKI